LHGIFASQQKTQIQFPNLYNWFPTFARRSESSHTDPKVSHAQESFGRDDFSFFSVFLNEQAALLEKSGTRGQQILAGIVMGP
jgi:hypothetical protein